MFKKTSKLDDGFSFDTGDELFPLDFDDMMNDPPPKGVKGYLKNVAKSVKNVGVKAFKTTMPDVDNLIQNMKPDLDDLGITGGKSAKIIKEAKSYLSMGKEMGKDAIESAKKRIQTGYFFKSEDDMDFGDMFGDDGDSSSSDGGGSIDFNTATVKAAKGQAKVALKNAKLQANATIGAAQATISAQNVLFSQQMVLSQEQHKQKMVVMKNIATNIGKIIKQNNMSIKAQMEYSIKSLAFAQDSTALLKDIRSSHWKQTRAAQELKNETSKKQKIYGSGFNITGMLKHTFGSMASNSGLDALSTMNSMLDSMSGLGMSKKDMIAGMIKDMIFEGAMDKITSKNFKSTARRLNSQAEGLPMQINKIMGEISKGNSKLTQYLKKIPGVGDFLADRVTSFASNAHLNEFASKNKGYDKHSEGLTKVHPFDGKAHKAITEVIPMILSKIEAGVNHHDEYSYDYGTNSYSNQTKRVRKSLENAKQEAAETRYAYGDLTETASGILERHIASGSNMRNKKGEVDVSKVKKLTTFLYEFMAKNEQILNPSTILSLLPGKNNTYYNSFKEQYLSASGLIEADFAKSVQAIMAPIIDWSKNYPDKFERFQNGMSSYVSDLNNKYTEIENRERSLGSSIIFDNITMSDQIPQNIKEVEERITNLQKRYNPKHASSAETKRYQEEYKKLSDKKRALLVQKASTVQGLNEYTIGQDDQSTNGLIKQILSILHQGIIVYPNNSEGALKGIQKRSAKFYKANKSRRDAKNSADNAFQEAMDKENSEFLSSVADRAKYKQSLDDRYWENDRADVLKKFKILDVISNPIESIMGMTASTIGSVFYGSRNRKDVANMNKLKAGGANIKGQFDHVKQSIINSKDEYVKLVAEVGHKEAIKQIAMKKSKELGTRVSESEVSKTFKEAGLAGVAKYTKTELQKVGTKIAESKIGQAIKHDATVTIPGLANDIKVTLTKKTHQQLVDLVGEEKALKIEQQAKGKEETVVAKIKELSGKAGAKINDIKGHFARGSREEGTLEDQILDKKEAAEEKEREERKDVFGMMKDFFKNITKAGGLTLSKKTMDEFEENNAALADSFESSSGGMLDSILSKVPGGDKIKAVLDKVPGKKGLGKIGGFIGGSKVALKSKSFIGRKLGKLGKNMAKKGGMFGSVGKSIQGFGQGMAKSSGSTIKAAGGAAKSKGIIGKGLELIGKGLSSLFKTLGKSAKLPMGAIKSLTTGLMSGIKTIAGKIAQKIAAFAAATGIPGGLVVPLATAAATFTATIARPKKTREALGLGAGQQVTWGMRLSHGLAAAIDGFLLGIPGVVASILGKGSLFQWFFELFGAASDKEAIERYKRYNVLRSKIYGIDNPDKLNSFENRDLGNKIGRGALQVLTLGIAKSNDEKDSSLLGFQSTDIFKYWKEKKYNELTKLREEMAEPYGGIKVVDEMNRNTGGMGDGLMDKVGDSIVGNEYDEEQAAKEKEAIANQEKFRTEYLKAARDWVVSNKLAWLTNRTTIEEFKKITGKIANADLSTKDKIKNRVKTGLQASLAFGIAGPVGLIAFGANKLVKKITGKSVVEHTKDLTLKVIDKLSGAKFDNSKEGMNSSTQRGFDESTNRDMDKTLNEETQNKLKVFLDIIRDVFTHTAVKSMAGISVSYPLCVKVMNFVGKYIDQDELFAQSLEDPITKYSNKQYRKSLLNKLLKLFREGAKSPMDSLGLTGAPEEMVTNAVRITGGIVKMFSEDLSFVDEACKVINKKTLKLTIYDMLTSGAVKANAYDNFVDKRAKLFGAEVEPLREYEKRVGNSRYRKKRRTGFVGGIANFGMSLYKKFIKKEDVGIHITDEGMEAGMLRFKDVSIYKFWRDNKYKPLNKIEISLASQYSTDIADLLSDSSENTEAQNKFRSQFLTEATKYIKSKKLEWLTYRTTLEEFNKRAKEGTLQDNSGTYTDPVTGATIAGQKRQKGEAAFDYATGVTHTGTDKANIGNTAENQEILNSDDNEKLAQKIAREWNYSMENSRIMAQATGVIQNYIRSADPNYFGDAKDSVNLTNIDGNGPEGSTGATNGGFASGVSEGFRVVERFKDKAVAAMQGTTQRAKDALGSIINSGTDTDTYDFSGKTPKSTVMNSIVSDFAKNFGTELNKKLDILQEIHKETLRHNGVSEQFFISALKMLQAIASNTSNSGMSSSIDNMLNNLIK